MFVNCFTAFWLFLAFQCFNGAVLHNEDANDRKSYDGYQLLRVYANTTESLQLVHRLYANDTTMRLDFWNIPGSLGKGIDVMVPPLTLQKFTNLLNDSAIEYEIRMSNVQDAIEKEGAARKFGASFQHDFVGSPSSDFRVNQYHTYSEIQQWMQQLARTYPNRIQVSSIGNSHEGRSIDIIKIGTNKLNKAGFWIDGGIHAREWIAPAVCIYLINELVSKYDSDPKIKQYVDEINWYILPVVNPDGFEYSRTRDRMWRKNRNPNRDHNGQPQEFNFCWGVDLNRNFDWDFGGAGSSWNPCSEIYNGIAAFSEPETRVIRDYITNHQNEMEGFVTLHSYSQIWMFPYGHAINTYADDWQELKAVAIEGSRDLQQLYGTKYIVDTGANALYPAAGGSDDWAKGKMRLKYVYLIELRPDDFSTNSVYGFLLPESQIIPTGLETWTGLQVIANRMLQKRGVTPVNSASPTTPYLIATDTPDPLCFDKDPHCKWWRQMGACTNPQWQETVRQSCALSCQLCISSAEKKNSLTTTAPRRNSAGGSNNANNRCKDANGFASKCQRWMQDQRNICQKIPNYMRKNCSKSCGFCNNRRVRIKGKE